MTVLSSWAAAFLAAEISLLAVWVPALALDPPAPAGDQDIVTIVLLVALLLGPTAWATGLLAGRTGDERRRFAWLMGFGLLTAVASLLIVSFSGDLFACSGESIQPPPGAGPCTSTLAERVFGILAAQAAIAAQWAVARREWFYRPGRPQP